VRVSVDGQPVSGVDYDGERLRIALGRKFERGERFTLAVDYCCKPRRVFTLSGLTRSILIGAGMLEPRQDDDSRFYWPCVDLPVEKATSEMFCTVPAGVTVLPTATSLTRATCLTAVSAGTTSSTCPIRLIS